MNKSVNNVTRSIGNIAKATTGALSSSTELLADSTEALSSTVSATPAVLKALLQVPFAAAKGYLMESEGLSEERAELAAYHYIKQDLSETITQAGESGGKLLASLFADEDNADAKPKAESKAA